MENHSTTQAYRSPTYNSGDVVKFKVGNVAYYGLILAIVQTFDGHWYEIMVPNEELTVLEENILCKMEEVCGYK